MASNYSKHFTCINSALEILLAARNNIQYQARKNTWFIFFNVKSSVATGISSVTQWFLATCIPSSWSCPHSCKMSFQGPSSMSVLKARKKK